MTVKTYGPLNLTFKDREDWMLPTVLKRQARVHGDKVLFREGEGRKRQWTYCETLAIANRIGNALVRRGYRKGDRLAIMMKNCPEYIFTWFGAMSAGVVEVPIHPDYTGYFLEHVVNLVAPVGMVVDPEAVDPILASCSSLPPGLEFFVVGDDRAGTEAIAKLRTAGWAAESFETLMSGDDGDVAVDVRYTDLALILSTSGTTGPSKGVMMSHAQLYFFSEQTKLLVQLRENDVYKLSFPMNHANARVMTAFPSIIAGASFVIFDKFSPSRFIERVQQHGITVANLLGLMMAWIMQQPSVPGEKDNPLRCVMSAPTPFQLGREFRERFGVDDTVEGFGQTEISIPMLSPCGLSRPEGAAGLLCEEWFDVRIADPETDEEVEVGKVGELLVRPRSPWIINSGYWGMPEATAASCRNLWFHTGDALRRDAEGWYYFVDRIKDTLRRRGENISSFEVEQALGRHPDVAECSVVAAASEYSGGEDEILAVVVVTSEVSCEELAEWARMNMPRFLVPRYWRIVAELPRTPSAKVRKVELRKEGLAVGTYDAEKRQLSDGALKQVNL